MTKSKVKPKLINANELLMKIKYMKRRDDFCKFSIDYFQLLAIIKQMRDNRNGRRKEEILL